MPLPKDPIKAEETRRIMSEASKKRMADPDYRKKISEAHKGKKQTPESIAKRVAANTGQQRSPRTKKNCAFCGKELLLAEWEKNRLFCSMTCKGKWQSENAVGEKGAHWQGGKITKNCEECGNEFSFEKTRSKAARFCSQHCKGIWLAKHEKLPKLPHPFGPDHPQWTGGDLTKKCEVCGINFDIKRARKENARFCSTTCKGIWMSNNLVGEKHGNRQGGGVTQKCLECGKEFTIKMSQKAKGRGIFCSRACRAKFKSTIKICEECGKEFIIGNCREDTARFCSVICKGNWQSKNILGENHPLFNKPITEETRKKLIESHKGKKQSKEQIEKRASQMRRENHPGWKGGESTINCYECGKEFKIKISQIAQEEKRNFCSRTCKGVWMSKNIVAEKHPNWTGGPKDYCEKWSLEFRRRIRAFFNFECAECGTPQNEKLFHCHHIYYDKKACCSVNEDGKYLSNLGVKGNPHSFEIIGDPNKFILLCDSCHAKSSGKKKREFWARHFEEIINQYYLGRSYFTKEEYEKIR